MANVEAHPDPNEVATNRTLIGCVNTYLRAKAFAQLDAERAEFGEAGKPYWGTHYEQFYIRGYDDKRCGRPLAYLGATCAGDAYVAGWNLALKQRDARSL